MPIYAQRKSGLGILAFLRQRRDDVNLWEPEEDAEWREMLSVANDGIISSAAIIQGLLMGGATGAEAMIGVLALIVIGMVGTFASQFNESDSERVSQWRIAEAEQRSLETEPEAEFAELVSIYEKKGLTHELSVEVARQLTDRDALKAQLEAEYDLDELPSRLWPWKQAALAAGVFFLGSALPLVLLVILPWDVRGEVTVVSVMLALAISGWIGHLVEHSVWWRSMLRTVLVGVIILGISTLAGSLVTF